MSKVYFYYSAMNAGKSTTLLQSSYNYQERGMNTLVLAPALDTRAGTGKVASRIGLSAEARAFKRDENLFTLVEEDHEKRILSCVLVDEAQFLTRRRSNNSRTSPTACACRCSATGCARTFRATSSRAASGSSLGRTI
jgi:thymidine kinase